MVAPASRFNCRVPEAPAIFLCLLTPLTYEVPLLRELREEEARLGGTFASTSHVFALSPLFG
jgi:hypothetical protein